ncbi:GntR family transcriptional regulator [Geomicrobium sp. JCM 19039]|uniref:GntR family transcriptional regulator n=1 Tax=Geomicrobium sp. JCM 19039 TaxID=1460636 RepID=UPI00045F233F|nr:GntR family transcriptional regulator [Geomicrobium sp. JCM 19039]GAK12320.1 transcriptional regulator, GntR family [Geomicrobium sp. JCM 19039]
MNRTNFKGSTREYVYEKIRESILSLELTPGTVISEKEISDDLEVSRTPVREAFLKLTEDELLTVLPQRGSFVTLIDLDHVEEARFLREQAEVGMMKLACHSFPESKRLDMLANIEKQKLAKEKEDEQALFLLDRDFHLFLAEGTNKKRVWQVIQRMDVHSQRLRKLSMNLKLNWNLLIEQHEAMVQAIEQKDERAGMEIMHEHLTLLQYDQSPLKAEFPDYFQ